jgi:hypothetical protein
LATGFQAWGLDASQNEVLRAPAAGQRPEETGASIAEMDNVAKPFEILELDILAARNRKTKWK